MLLGSLYGDVSNYTMTSEASDVTTDGVVLTSSTATNDSEMTQRLLMHGVTSLTTSIKTVGGGSDVADMLMRQQVNWYTVIAILSALVLVGMCFTICRLVMKASAHEKAGQGWQRDSLLYSRKDSIIPISLHFDQTDDSLYS